MEQGQEGLRQFSSKMEQYQPSIAESNFRSIHGATSHEFILKEFKNYQPASDLIDIQKIHKSPNLKVKKYKESVYYGEVVNTKRHGQGIMIYNNERLYEGEWECDLKHGRGYEQFANGCAFKGEYVNGKPEGVGRYTWLNGEFYEGEWTNGLKNGSGMWQGAKGDSYVGQWKIGKADGYGVHVWINGDRYQGQFKQCLKHGKGTEKFANGDLYQGYYSQGKPAGFGEYYWANGSYFKGSFKNGLRDGHGIWKKGPGNTDKYEGEYGNDKKQGYGIFTWSSGNIYKGTYKDDARNGYGEMYWSDGSYYKGQWKLGIQHGEGMIFVPGQGLKKGIFENNVLVEIKQEQDQQSQFRQRKITTSFSVSNSKGTFRSQQIRDRVNSQYQQKNPKKNMTLRQSKTIKGMPPLKKSEDTKPHFVKNKNTVNVQKNGEIAPTLEKKQRILHSAFYMHRLHKRVSTAHNQLKNASVSKIQDLSIKSKGQIVQQLKTFTRKIINAERFKK